MVERAVFIENGFEERNGKNEALGRRLEKLRRDFGPVFLAALNDPGPEITLENVWAINYGKVRHATKYRLDLIDIAVHEVKQMVASGGSSVVELTCGGLKPDPRGLAEVSARSLDTGAIRKTTTDDNGAYRISSVPAGSYELSVSTSGFKTEVRSGIDVTVGSDVAVNFALTVGAISEKVEVTAEAPQVDASSSTLGGFVNSNTIRGAPAGAHAAPARPSISAGWAAPRARTS